MPYVKNVWVNGDTSKPLDDTRLNHNEDGTFLAMATAESAAATALAASNVAAAAQVAADLDADTAALVGDVGTATGTALSATIDEVATEVATPLALAAVRNSPPPIRKSLGSVIVFMFDDPEVGAPDTDLVTMLGTKGIPVSWAVTAANIDSANLSTRGNPYRSSAYWQNLIDTRGDELVNHSATHMNIRDVDDADLEYEVNGALEILTEKGFHVDGFVYPNEDSGPATRRKVSERHLWAVGNLNGAVGNRVAQPLQTYTIGRRHIGADPVAGLAGNKNAITGAVNRGDQVLILWTHPYTLTTTPYMDALAELIDFAIASGLPVVTMGEAMRRLHNVYEAGDPYVDPVSGATPWTAMGADGVLRSSVLPKILGSNDTLPTAATQPQGYTAGIVTRRAIASSDNTDWPTTGVAGVMETDRAVESTSYLFVTQWWIDTNDRVFMRRGANATTWGSWREFRRHQSASSASLASAANALNTTGKVAGGQVWDLTLGKPVWASGSAATATWVDATGAVVHTPA